MNTASKYPINHEDDGELLGFVAKDTAGWQAQTVFGLPFERTTDQRQAETIVRDRGLSYLMGVWQYYDEDDHDWHPCVIKEANQSRVTVIRTNAMGMQEIDDSKVVIIRNPSELNLQKT